MLIYDLLAAKTATFFLVRKNLSNKAIRELFVTLRENYNVSTRDIFRHTRVPEGNLRWSAICFSYETTPSFLETGAGIRELLCGYLLLVEYEQHLAIFSSRITLPARFKSTHLSPVPISRVEGAIAKESAVFQRMRMRNMSVSQYAMRNKTLEAADLANVVGPGGSRRYAPQTYTVAVDGSFSTATPSTGRIGIRSIRVGFNELIEFAVGIIDSLRAELSEVSPFIRSFARPMSLADALAEFQPITMAIDTNRVVDAIAGDGATIRLLHGGDHPTELNEEELHALIEQLDQALRIDGADRVRTASLVDGTGAATISLNKTRIALRSLTLAPASTIEVESCEFPLGTDPERRPLHKYLDEIDALIVLFDDVGLAYIDGQVFRDESMLDGGASFLRYLHPEQALANATSEKGDFSAAQREFDRTSTFGVVVNEVGAADTILICDDLGDEWADFIGIRQDGALTHISFYHAKHGPLGLGASSFHVAVGQAIKNLGNMSFPEERIENKVQGWGATYNAPGQATQISRVIRSNAPDLLDALRNARTAPDSIRRATIVTSSISRHAIETAFASIQNGQQPAPSFVQLYWLLQSFFSACAEVGAVGAIVCQP